jgi:hypothetical protein
MEYYRSYSFIGGETPNFTKNLPALPHKINKNQTYIIVDSYELANLLSLLRKARKQGWNNGDWHGQLEWKAWEALNLLEAEHPDFYQNYQKTSDLRTQGRRIYGSNFGDEWLLGVPYPMTSDEPSK